MTIVKYRRELETLPRGYGFAWIDWDTHRCVCLPVPLNFIARHFRDWWYRVRMPQGSDVIERAYQRGAAEGWDRGTEAMWRKFEILKQEGFFK
jgi:hypothetical protein